MKRTKKIWILLGILAALCLVTVLIMQITEKKEQIKNTEAVILSIPSDSVQALSWEYDGSALSFHKNEVWHWDEDEAFPVDETVINKLLSVFESFGASFIIEDAEDISQYGLDDPVCTIQLTTDGGSYELLLGSYSTMDSQRYVSIGDGNVYLVKTDPLDTYDIELSDTILHDDTPYFETINGLTFAGAEEYSIYRDENSTLSYCSSDVYFTDADGASLPLDTSLVEDYGTTISLLSLKDYVSYNVTEEELAAWGLDAPTLTVTVNYSQTEEDESVTESTLVLNIGLNQEELAEKTAAEENEEEYSGTVTAYARVGDSQLVYEISQSEYQSLMAASYNDLRHKDVFTADFDSVTQLDISLEGESCSVAVQLPDEEGAENSYIYLDEEIDISDIRSAIKALTLTDFTEEEATEKEEINLVLTLDDENHPSITITAYRYDSTSCLIAVNGQTVGFAARADIVDLTEAVYALILG